MKTILLNTIDLKQKEVTEKCKQLVTERVSKKEFGENKAFMLSMVREAKAAATHA